MILLHERLPCSENFFRYFKNYDRYMEDKQKSGKDPSKSPTSTDSETEQYLKIGVPPKSPVRSIESPKYGLGLSPINRFLTQHSPS